MSRNFTLSCCSTVDVPYHYLESRSIPVLFYTYVVDDVTYVDDMGRDPQALPHFYEMLAAGKLPQTSQVNVAEYGAATGCIWALPPASPAPFTTLFWRRKC